MNDCRFKNLLSAYHDDELDAELRRIVEAHLADCPACAGELEAMRRLSARVGGAGADEFDESVLAGVHDAVERAAAEEARGSQVLHTAGFFGALAASVLVISGIWLRELPSASSTGSVAGGLGGGATPRALEPEWERIAVNLRAQPRPSMLDDSPFSPRYAYAVNWMLNNLSTRDRKPWSKPNSL